jgi:ABC-type bacteriocin/lantibiotic exporter with double-glycine peptidase domain
MLQVPRIRQPNRVTCLPACVWAVLRYQELPVELDDIIAACRLDSRGAVQEIALQGLRDEGWEVESLTSFDAADVAAELAEGRPLIISLARHERVAHAVVVCAIEGQVVTVMDPLEGGYVQMPLAEVLWQLEEGLSGGFFIAGADPSVCD